MRDNYSAASDSDFVGGALPSGIISFADGEITKPLTIYCAGDTAIESSELFQVTLSGPTNAPTNPLSSYSGIIINDDIARIDISSSGADTIQSEGNGRVTTYSFTVSRNSSSDQAMVRYLVTGVADGASDAASANDFEGNALPIGVINFNDGESSKLLTINVAGDTAAEGNERFAVTLSNPTNAMLGASAAHGIITNDDGALISIGSVGANSKSEGDGGGTAYSFTVSRVGASGVATVNYAVAGAADGTSAAASASDFGGGALPSGSISFASGETSKLLTINVAGDTKFEGSERFNVTLSNPINATLGVRADHGIIINDDLITSNTIYISSADADTDKNEGDRGATAYLFTVIRSGADGEAGAGR